MKNYLRLSKFATKVSRIIPAITGKVCGKQTKKENAFVILNSDNDYGFYIQRLVRELKKYPELIEIPKVLRKANLRNIETGNLIVFGDATGSTNFDYRVVRDARELDHLDGRRFKAYDIINDFDKIVKKVRAYADDNIDNENDYEFSDYDVFVKNRKKDRKPKTCRTVEINIDCNIGQRTPKYKTHSFEENYTIFDNWVKVGYNQYDIYVDLFGNQFIYINGAKLFVNKDRYGKRYLTKR